MSCGQNLEPQGVSLAYLRVVRLSAFAMMADFGCGSQGQMSHRGVEKWLGPGTRGLKPHKLLASDAALEAPLFHGTVSTVHSGRQSHGGVRNGFGERMRCALNPRYLNLA